MATWKDLLRKASGQEAQAEVNIWEELPSLIDVFKNYDGGIIRWDDNSVQRSWKIAHPVALRYCYDVKRFNLLGAQSDFMKSMVERADITHNLTVGQVRGVLNVLGGGIKYNRGRFWKSRGHRRDRDMGLSNCLVCGGPLTTDEAVNRGLGETCYRRVMGG